MIYEALGKVSSLPLTTQWENRPLGSFSILITHDGTTYDYTKAICTMNQYPQKVQKISDISTFDFDLAGLDLFGLPVPGRGDYLIFNTRTYPQWFTGYIINNPQPTIMGKDSQGIRRWLYTYQANSDDYILNLQSMPVNQVFINTTAGGIIRKLVNMLMPGVFNTQFVQDGPLIGKYVLDPTKAFSDVVKDLAGNAFYRFYGQNKALFFYPIDQAPQNVIIDGNNKYFTPAGLQIQPSTDPIVNDCTVFGDVEPQGVMTDYFLGDGFTGEFQLTTGIYGLAEEILLDEQFTNSSIDGNTWSVFDSVGNFLQVSQGYLNCLGGNSTGAFDVFLQSTDPVPLEGTVRITHGQYDFTTQSDGVLGALYTDLPTPPVGGVFNNCIYGLRIAPGPNGSSTIYPIVNGVVDTSQSLNISNFTMYNFRYTARTILTHNVPNRTQQGYSYFGSDGSVGSVSIAQPPSPVTFTTFMAVVDPNTGAIQKTVNFINTSTLSADTQYAFYTPFISNNLNATVTGITVSTPMQASLDLKSLEHPTYTLTAPGGDVNFVPDRCHFAGQPMPLNADWTINGRIDSISNLNTGQQKAGFMVRLRTPTLGENDRFVALAAWSTGVASLRYRAGIGLNVVEVGVIDQNNGVTDGLTLPQYFQLTKSGSTFNAYYSSDGDNYTQFAKVDVVMDGFGDTTVVGMFVTGEDFNTPEQVTAVFQEVNINSVPISGLISADVGYSGLGWDSGFTQSTLNWTSQILGVNELDTLDGLAPVAAIVQQTNSVLKNKNDRGSYQYNPGQCTLEYFSDATTQTTAVPDLGDLVKCRYHRSGTSFARVVDNTEVEAESQAWGDSGHRSTIVTNLNPLPRNSDECIAAATATINSSGWQHYNGSYTQTISETNQFGFAGEPVAGAVLQFRNLSSDIVGVSQEIIQEVQSYFIGDIPQEIFSHDVSFGPINTAQKFVARLNQPQGITIPQDTAYIPPAVDIDAYDQSILMDITDVQFVSCDRTHFNFAINDTLNAGENLEIRYSDDSWGPDSGKNLVARILHGQPQSFSTPRAVNGRIAFVKRYDTRNLCPYSEDLTRWFTTTGVAVSNSKAIDPDDKLASVSTITVTQPGWVYITFPATIATNGAVASMLYVRGPHGAPLSAVASSSFAPGYGIAAYGTNPYGDPVTWQMTINDVINSNLTGGWDLVKLTGFAPNPMSSVVLSIEFAEPGVYQIDHVQFELNSVPTIYCRTNGAPYGAQSRFSAGVRAQLPLIPPAPTGRVDITDPTTPIITLVLPAIETDVWGFEIRDADNFTVLNQAQYGQAGFGQGYDMTFTVASNTQRNRVFYLYTFNLLKEYSDPFVLQMNIPLPVVGDFAFSDEYFTMSFSGAANQILNPTFSLNTTGTGLGTIVPQGSKFTDGWIVFQSFPPLQAIYENFVGTGLVWRIADGAVISGNNGFIPGRVYSDKVAVHAGQRVFYGAYTGRWANAVAPSGITILQRIGLFFFDDAGNQILEYAPTDENGLATNSRLDLAQYGAIIAPTGSASVALQCSAFIQNTTAAPITIHGLIADMRFRNCWLGIEGASSSLKYAVDVFTDAGMTNDVWHGSVTNGLVAFKQLDYLNQRYINIVPSDAMGPGITVTLDHIYAPPPPVEFTTNEASSVTPPNSPTLDPTVPPRFAGVNRSYISESWKNYGTNRFRYIAD